MRRNSQQFSCNNIGRGQFYQQTAQTDDSTSKSPKWGQKSYQLFMQQRSGNWDSSPQHKQLQVHGPTGNQGLHQLYGNSIGQFSNPGQFSNQRNISNNNTSMGIISAGNTSQQASIRASNSSYSRFTYRPSIFPSGQFYGSNPRFEWENKGPAVLNKTNNSAVNKQKFDYGHWSNTACKIDYGHQSNTACSIDRSPASVRYSDASQKSCASANSLRSNVSTPSNPYTMGSRSDNLEQTAVSVSLETASYYKEDNSVSAKNSIDEQYCEPFKEKLSGSDIQKCSHNLLQSDAELKELSAGTQQKVVSLSTAVTDIVKRYLNQQKDQRITSECQKLENKQKEGVSKQEIRETQQEIGESKQEIDLKTSVSESAVNSAVSKLSEQVIMKRTNGSANNSPENVKNNAFLEHFSICQKQETKKIFGEQKYDIVNQRTSESAFFNKKEFDNKMKNIEHERENLFRKFGVVNKQNTENKMFSQSKTVGTEASRTPLSPSQSTDHTVFKTRVKFIEDVVIIGSEGEVSMTKIDDSKPYRLKVGMIEKRKRKEKIEKYNEKKAKELRSVSDGHKTRVKFIEDVVIIGSEGEVSMTKIDDSKPYRLKVGMIEKRKRKEKIEKYNEKKAKELRSVSDGHKLPHSKSIIKEKLFQECQDIFKLKTFEAFKIPKLSKVENCRVLQSAGLPEAEFKEMKKTKLNNDQSEKSEVKKTPAMLKDSLDKNNNITVSDGHTLLHSKEDSKKQKEQNPVDELCTDKMKLKFKRNPDRISVKIEGHNINKGRSSEQKRSTPQFKKRNDSDEKKEEKINKATEVIERSYCNRSVLDGDRITTNVIRSPRPSVNASYLAKSVFPVDELCTDKMKLKFKRNPDRISVKIEGHNINKGRSSEQKRSTPQFKKRNDSDEKKEEKINKATEVIERSYCNRSVLDGDRITTHVIRSPPPSVNASYLAKSVLDKTTGLNEIENAKSIGLITNKDMQVNHCQMDESSNLADEGPYEAYPLKQQTNETVNAGDLMKQSRMLEKNMQGPTIAATTIEQRYLNTGDVQNCDKSLEQNIELVNHPVVCQSYLQPQAVATPGWNQPTFGGWNPREPVPDIMLHSSDTRRTSVFMQQVIVHHKAKAHREDKHMLPLNPISSSLTELNTQSRFIHDYHCKNKAYSCDLDVTTTPSSHSFCEWKVTHAGDAARKLNHLPQSDNIILSTSSNELQAGKLTHSDVKDYVALPSQSNDMDHLGVNTHIFNESKLNEDTDSKQCEWKCEPLKQKLSLEQNEKDNTVFNSDKAVSQMSNSENMSIIFTRKSKGHKVDKSKYPDKESEKEDSNIPIIPVTSEDDDNMEQENILDDETRLFVKEKPPGAEDKFPPDSIYKVSMTPETPRIDHNLDQAIKSNATISNCKVDPEVPKQIKKSSVELSPLILTRDMESLIDDYISSNPSVLSQIADYISSNPSVLSQIDDYISSNPSVLSQIDDYISSNPSVFLNPAWLPQYHSPTFSIDSLVSSSNTSHDETGLFVKEKPPGAEDKFPPDNAYKVSMTPETPRIDHNLDQAIKSNATISNCKVDPEVPKQIKKSSVVLSPLILTRDMESMIDDYISSNPSVILNPSWLPQYHSPTFSIESPLSSSNTSPAQVSTSLSPPILSPVLSTILVELSNEKVKTGSCNPNPGKQGKKRPSSGVKKLSSILPGRRNVDRERSLFETAERFLGKETLSTKRKGRKVDKARIFKPVNVIDICGHTDNLEDIVGNKRDTSNCSTDKETEPVIINSSDEDEAEPVIVSCSDEDEVPSQRDQKKVKEMNKSVNSNKVNKILQSSNPKKHGEKPSKRKLDSTIINLQDQYETDRKLTEDMSPTMDKNIENGIKEELCTDGKSSAKKMKLFPDVCVEKSTDSANFLMKEKKQNSEVKEKEKLNVKKINETVTCNYISDASEKGAISSKEKTKGHKSCDKVTLVQKDGDWSVNTSKSTSKKRRKKTVKQKNISEVIPAGITAELDEPKIIKNENVGKDCKKKKKKKCRTDLAKIETSGSEAKANTSSIETSVSYIACNKEVKSVNLNERKDNKPSMSDSVPCKKKNSKKGKQNLKLAEQSKKKQDEANLDKEIGNSSSSKPDALKLEECQKIHTSTLSKNVKRSMKRKSSEMGNECADNRLIETTDQTEFNKTFRKVSSEKKKQVKKKNLKDCMKTVSDKTVDVSTSTVTEEKIRKKHPSLNKKTNDQLVSKFMKDGKKFKASVAADRKTAISKKMLNIKKSCCKKKIHSKGVIQKNCRICNQSFADLKLLNRHTLKAHQFRCTWCKIEFKDKEASKKHYYSHMKKSFSCDTCEMRFVSAYGYEQHRNSKKHADWVQRVNNLQTGVCASQLPHPVPAGSNLLQQASHPVSSNIGDLYLQQPAVDSVAQFYSNCQQASQLSWCVLNVADNTLEFYNQNVDNYMPCGQGYLASLNDGSALTGGRTEPDSEVFVENGNTYAVMSNSHRGTITPTDLGSSNTTSVADVVCAEVTGLDIASSGMNDDDTAPICRIANSFSFAHLFTK